ncbi:MAG TPA: hypothetical protein VFF52_10750 [Isosphaeraceae bacterium]|nr:hypothetical protein [Isosphaeraceae bacterium]
MNARRSSTKSTIRLETLEDRITPVALDHSLAHLAATRGALLSHTQVSPDPGSTARLNLRVIHGHRQVLVAASTDMSGPNQRNPQRIHPSIGVVSSVENSAPVTGQVVSQMVLRSTSVPSAPSTGTGTAVMPSRPGPVLVPPNPVTPPTVPLDPDGGATTPPSNPPSGSTGNPPTPATPAPNPPFTLR